MKKIYTDLNEIAQEITTLKNLSVIIEKLYLYLYDKDFDDCNKDVMLALFIKNTKLLEHNYKKFLATLTNDI